MTQLLQPTLSLLLGVALSVYGLIHSSNHYPGTDRFRELWQSLPALSSVLIFMLGLIAVLSGLGLLLTGIQQLRQRYRHLDRVLHTPNDPYEDDPRYSYR